MMHESKGQHIGKVPYLHLFHHQRSNGNGKWGSKSELKLSWYRIQILTHSVWVWWSKQNINCVCMYSGKIISNKSLLSGEDKTHRFLKQCPYNAHNSLQNCKDAYAHLNHRYHYHIYIPTVTITWSCGDQKLLTSMFWNSWTLVDQPVQWLHHPQYLSTGSHPIQDYIYIYIHWEVKKKTQINLCNVQLLQYSIL